MLFEPKYFHKENVDFTAVCCCVFDVKRCPAVMMS